MPLNNYKIYDNQDKLSKKIHFTIDVNGNWYFHGLQNPGAMKREALVKLFSDRAFHRVGDKYYLKSPFESYEVEVEDVPYIITQYTDNGLGLITNLGEKITLNEKRKIFLKKPSFSDIVLPYVEIKPGFSARLSKAVREDLINLALLSDYSDLKPGDILYFQINGVKHPLAKLET